MEISKLSRVSQVPVGTEESAEGRRSCCRDGRDGRGGAQCRGQGRPHREDLSEVTEWGSLQEGKAGTRRRLAWLERSV